MGITGLLKTVHEMKVPCRKAQLRGTVIGVDVYVWLHRGLRGYTRPQSMVQCAAKELTKQAQSNRQYSRKAISIHSRASNISSPQQSFRVVERLQKGVNDGIYVNIASALVCALKAGDRDVWTYCCTTDPTDSSLTQLYFVVREQMVEKLLDLKVYSNTYLDSYNGYSGGIRFIVSQLTGMLSMGVIPLLVFDGQQQPAKYITNSKRKTARKNFLYDSIEEMNIRSTNNGYIVSSNNNNDASFKKGMYVDNVYAMLVFNIASNVMKVPCIVSMFEADACLARLYKNDTIDAVISIDSDLLMLGVGRLITEFNAHTDVYEMYDHVQLHRTQLLKQFISNHNDYKSDYPYLYKQHVDKYGYGMHRQYVLQKQCVSSTVDDYEIGTQSDSVLLEAQISRLYQMLLKNKILRILTDEYKGDVLPACVQTAADSVTAEIIDIGHNSFPICDDEVGTTAAGPAPPYPHQSVLQDVLAGNIICSTSIPILFAHTLHATTHHISPLLLLMQFICLLSGCDYLQSQKGIGLVTAASAVRSIGGIGLITSLLEHRTRDIQSYEWISNGTCSNMLNATVSTCSNVTKRLLHTLQLPSFLGCMLYAVDAATLLKISMLIDENLEQRSALKSARKKRSNTEKKERKNDDQDDVQLDNNSDDDDNYDNDSDNEGKQADKTSDAAVVKHPHKLKPHIYRALHYKSDFTHHVNPFLVSSQEECKCEVDQELIPADYMPLQMPYVIESACSIVDEKISFAISQDAYILALLRSMQTINHQLTASYEYNGDKVLTSHDIVVRATEVPLIYPSMYIDTPESQAQNVRWTMPQGNVSTISQDANSSCTSDEKFGIINKLRYHSVASNRLYDDSKQTDRDLVLTLLQKNPSLASQTKHATQMLCVRPVCNGSCTLCKNPSTNTYLLYSYLSGLQPKNNNTDNELFNLYMTACNCIDNCSVSTNVVSRQDVMLLLATAFMTENSVFVETNTPLASPPAPPSPDLVCIDDTNMCVPSMHVSQTPSNTSAAGISNISWLTKPRLQIVSDLVDDGDSDGTTITTSATTTTTTTTNTANDADSSMHSPFYIRSISRKRNRSIEITVSEDSEHAHSVSSNLWGVSVHRPKPLDAEYNLKQLVQMYGDSLFRPQKIGPFTLHYEDLEEKKQSDTIIDTLFQTLNTTMKLNSTISLHNSQTGMQEIGIDHAACMLLYNELVRANQHCTIPPIDYSTMLRLYSDSKQQIISSALYIPCCGIAAPAFISAAISHGLVNSAYTSLGPHLRHHSLEGTSVLSLGPNEVPPCTPVLSKCAMIVESVMRAKNGPFVNGNAQKLSYNQFGALPRLSMEPYRHQGIDLYGALEQYYFGRAVTSNSSIYMPKTQSRLTKLNCSQDTLNFQSHVGRHWESLQIGINSVTGKIYIHKNENTLKMTYGCDCVFQYSDFRYQVSLRDKKAVNNGIGMVYGSHSLLKSVLGSMYVAKKGDIDEVGGDQEKILEEYRYLSRKFLSFLQSCEALQQTGDCPVTKLSMAVSVKTPTNYTPSTPIKQQNSVSIESSPNTVWDWDMFQSPTKTPSASTAKNIYTKATSGGVTSSNSPAVCKTPIGSALYSRNKKSCTPASSSQTPIMTSPFSALKSSKPKPGSIFEQLSRRITPAQPGNQDPNTVSQSAISQQDQSHDIFSLTQSVSEELSSTPIEIIEILSSQEISPSSKKQKPSIYCSISSNTSSSSTSIFKPQKKQG